MRISLWMGAIAVSIVAACNQTVGECWPRAEEDFGAGGGVIVTGGTGAFGNAPSPQPQGIKYPEAECNIAGQGPCFEKCLADYDAAALECAKIANDLQRRACQDGAHTAYKNCSQTCQQTADCKEACKEQCDKANVKCIKNCPKGDKNCMQECNEENGRCIKECDKRCK